MSFDSEVDISGAIDTAETREAGGDLIIRKLKITLQGGKGKYGWTGQEPGSGLSDRPRAILGQIHF
jgi:hypothetical protein